jgi:Bax protein
MLKHTQSTIKVITYTTLAVTAVLAAAFLAGTFHPNKWTVNKIEDRFHEQELEQVYYLGLQEPEFEYKDKASFIEATGRCVEYINYTTDKISRVPTSIIIAMAGIESGWGTSRFATEGNALFGVRTWDDNTPQMKPLELPDADFGVKKYQNKCDSVRDMIRILNTHPAYELFRERKEQQIDDGKWNYRELLEGMTAWSTNPDYGAIILSAIVDNQLP